MSMVREGGRRCTVIILTFLISHVNARAFWRKHNVVELRGGANKSGSDGLGLPSGTIQTNVDTTRVIIETSTSAAIQEGDLVTKNSESKTEEPNHTEASGAEESSWLIGEKETTQKNKGTGCEDSDESHSLERNDDDTLEQISKLRLKGKRLHDAGQFDKAADCFSRGADLLDPSEDEDFFTFKLHQALCCLKMEDYETAKDICTTLLELETMPILLRARALHRRAKAYLGLDNRENALDDARSAAMFGDSKAVELYGKLMRESRGVETGPTSAGDIDGASSFSSDLFESMLAKSLPASDTNNDADTVPSMLDMNSLLGGDSSNLAKSLLSSLSKRLDDDGTQEMLCGYLQGVDGSQLRQYAGMAGIPLSDDQATKLAKICQNTTKRGIKKIVKNGRRLVYTARLIRKTFKVIGKYKNVLILSSIFWWTSSVLSRPLPAKSTGITKGSKAATKAAQKVAKAAGPVGTKPVGLLKPRR